MQVEIWSDSIGRRRFEASPTAREPAGEAQARARPAAVAAGDAGALGGDGC